MLVPTVTFADDAETPSGEVSVQSEPSSTVNVSPEEGGLQAAGPAQEPAVPEDPAAEEAEGQAAEESAEEPAGELIEEPAGETAEEPAAEPAPKPVVGEAVVLGDIEPLDGAGPWTVTFSVEGDTDAIEAQTVDDGDAAYEPGAPAVPPGKTGFLGWSAFDPAVHEAYADDEFYVFQTPVKGDLTLYAVFSDVYLIQYKDAPGGTVVQTRALRPGAVIPGPDKAVADGIAAPTGKRLLYWYVEGGSDQAPFGFGSVTATSDLVLVPYFSDAWVVLFQTAGSYVEPQLVVDGQKAERPANDPVRAGYTFVRWAATPDGAEDFDFANTEIHATTTVYAVWQAEDIAYTIVYWYEKPRLPLDFDADDTANYAYHSSVPAVALPAALKKPAGSVLSFTPADLAIMEAAKPFPDFSELYRVSQASVNGDGTTVVNLYFTRKVYTFVFDMHATKTQVNSLDENNNTSPSGADPLNSSYITIGGVDYQSGGASGPKYQFETKYEMRLDDVWPSYGNVVSGNASFELYGWFIGNYAGVPHSDRLEAVADLLKAAEVASPATDDERTLTFAPQWQAVGAHVPHSRLYYLQIPNPSAEIQAQATELGDTSAETIDIAGKVWRTYVKYNGKYYKLERGENGYQDNNTKAQSVVFPAYTFQYAGNVPTPPNYPYSKLHMGITKGSGAYHFYADGTKHDKNDDTAQYIYFLYDASGEDLSFNPMGAAGDYPTQLLTAGTPLKDYEPEQPEREDYTFKGWYDNPDFNGSPIDFETAVMPAEPLMLFAKWVPSAITVRFYDGIGGAYLGEDKDLYAVDGGTVADPGYYIVNESYEGKGQFLGWVWLVMGQHPLAFGFGTQTLHSDLELYAQWKTEGFTITYLGADGAPFSPPLDGEEYALGTNTRVKPWPQDAAVPDGQVFQRWVTDGVDDGKLYYPYSELPAPISGDLVLRPLFAPLKESVSYTYHPATAGADPDEDVVIWMQKNEAGRALAGAIFTHPAKELIGWSPTEEGARDGTVDAAAGDYAIGAALANTGSESREFYAIWRAKTYALTFQAGTGGRLTGAGLSNGKKIVDGIPHETPWDNEWAPGYEADAGWHFVDWTPTQPSTVTQSQIFTANFEKDEYQVTYAPGDHGTWEAEVHTPLYYGDDTPAPTVDPTAAHDAGYTFVGWGEDIAEAVTGSKTYTAQWLANKDTAYTVEYYYQNEDGSYPQSADDRDGRQGMTGETARLTDADREPSDAGFAYTGDDFEGNVTEGVIAGDGSLVLRVHFKRLFTVAYARGDHGIWEDEAFGGLDYGQATPAPAVDPSAPGSHDAGWTFAGWDLDGGAVDAQVTGDRVYVAVWRANTDTPYAVEYYYEKQAAGGATAYGQTPDETAQRTGTTGQDVGITAADRVPRLDGYSLDASRSGGYSAVLAGDGSTVLRVYFALQLGYTEIVEAVSATDITDVTGGGGGGAAAPVAAAAAAPAAAAAAAAAPVVIPPADTPLVAAESEGPETIADVEPPLTTKEGPVWALLNLILTAACAAAFVRALARAKRRKAGGGEAPAEEADARAKRRRAALRALAGGSFAVSAVLFALTENIKNPMALTDAWTLWHVALAVLAVLLAYLCGGKARAAQNNA